MQKKFSAFTLFELAIALVIISSLLAIFTNLYYFKDSVKISAARNLTVNSGIDKINGLVAWYETSLSQSLKPSERYDGNEVTTWYSISPDSIKDQKNTLTAHASVPTNGLTYVKKGINDLPGISFNGASYSLFQLSSFFQGNLARPTVFLVLQPFTLEKVIFDSYSGASSHITLLSSSNLRLHAGLTTDQGPTDLAIGGKFIIVAYYNSTQSKFYINDAGEKVGSGNAGTNQLKGLSLGSYVSQPFAGFNGIMSEVLIYDRPLRTPERKDVMRYLSQKYDIPVKNL